MIGQAVGNLKRNSCHIFLSYVQGDNGFSTKQKWECTVVFFLDLVVPFFQVWQKELIRLRNAQKKMASELAYMINQAGAAAKQDTLGLKKDFEQIEILSEEMKASRKEFKEETYQPIIELKWVKDN